MRISDWSSDVCSSDLSVNPPYGSPTGQHAFNVRVADVQPRKAGKERTAQPFGQSPARGPDGGNQQLPTVVREILQMTGRQPACHCRSQRGEQRQARRQQQYGNARQRGGPAAGAMRLEERREGKEG